MNEHIKYFKNKFAALKETRLSYEPVWADIMDHLMPDAKGYLNTDNTSTEGERQDEIIYDGDPAEYARKCSAVMWSIICSPARPWFKRRMANPAFSEMQELNEWLDAVTERDYAIMQSSNFYQAVYGVFRQYPHIGTAAMIVDQDYENIIHCTTLNVGEYWLGLDGKGRVNALYRQFKLNAAKMKELFGDKVPKRILDTITTDKPMGGTHNIIHAIEPDTRKIAPFRKPWVSVYFLESGPDDDFLQVRGYNRKPFAAPRWYVNNNETYGKDNPGRNVLGDAMQLQTMVYTFMMALQKAIDPPTQAPEDTLEKNYVDTTPGAVNFYRNLNTGDPAIKRLFEFNPDLQAMWQAIQDKKQQIQAGLFVDLFLSVSMRKEKDMTAEEVRAISREGSLALGPGMLNTDVELLDELVDIVFDYALEAGVYPPLPEEVAQIIQGQEIKTDYLSLLAQSQKMVDLSRYEQILAYIDMIAPFDPTALVKVDFQQMIDEIQKLVGTAASTIRSDEAVAAIEKAQQQQQQTQNALQVAQVGADVAQKAGNIPMGQDTALTRILPGLGVQ